MKSATDTEARIAEVPERVRAYMKARHLNQQRMADRIGISQGTLSRILSGDQGIGISTLHQIAAAIEIDLDTLLGSVTETQVHAVARKSEPQFDVFLSYSNADQPVARGLANALRQQDLRVWFDVDELLPGAQWHKSLELAVQASRSVVVLVGEKSAGPWMDLEINALLVRAVADRKVVLPVFLPKAPVRPALPPFLGNRTSVDFRSGFTKEGLAKLIWGITGNKPTQPPKDKDCLPKLETTVSRADISRIVKYAPAELIGRENELRLLNDSWAKVQAQDSKRPHLLTFVALGGEGKTSLVSKWAAELAHQGWPGCDAAFAWSFYSQGTKDQTAASSDLFLKEALLFFAASEEDKQFAASNAGAFEKGQRLARLVGQRRSLLILDGLEPLQYAPASPTPGQLKDQGIAALLKGLAAASRGLSVVTTRYSLPEVKAFWQTTAPEVKLVRLSRDAGVHLLKTLGVKGTANEFATLVEDVKGHALTLTLLGGFLKRAFHGDIRQRDRVKFEKADEKMDGGHAFRTMAAYEQWLLRDGGDEGRREVAVLRLMGLFDRPADAGCLVALRSETIPGLTEPLAGLADDDWEYCLSGLEAAKLLAVNRDATGTLVSLDAHPHLREYFARQLRTQQPDAWHTAHRRLYEHLCATTTDKPQPTLEDLQPLYQAVAHGCQAGLQKEAAENVYKARILRGGEAYSIFRLGAVGSDLGAVACFFDQPWNRVAPMLSEADQAWLQNEAGFRLRAAGRLTEALGPMRSALEIEVGKERWESVAITTNNLSELDLTLGEVAGAVGDGEQAVIYADRRGDGFLRMALRASHADALNQAGRRAEAEARFRESEQIHAEHQPAFPLLYALPGFRYCDLLLAAPERGAWQQILSLNAQPSTLNLTASCFAVSQRAGQTLKWAEQSRSALLTTALDHLTLGRAAFYTAILEVWRDDLRGSPSSARELAIPVTFETARREFDAAVAGLRRAGTQHELPRGLLTRAWYSFAEASFFAKATKDESAHQLRDDAQEAARFFSRAQEDLDEAWEIAERGPMRLHMADIHLYRARLFGSRNSEVGSANEAGQYPWESPAADLAAAEKLINDCGYHRRDEELADAKAALMPP